MMKHQPKVTYQDLANILIHRCDGLILNNEVLPIAYRIGDCPDHYTGSYIKFYDGEGNKIDMDEYENNLHAYQYENTYRNYKGDIISEKEYRRQANSYEHESEIFQWFIITEEGAEFLAQFTDEYVVYLDALNLYLWGKQFYGMAWEDVELENHTIPEGIIERYRQMKI